MSMTKPNRPRHWTPKPDRPVVVAARLRGMPSFEIGDRVKILGGTLTGRVTGFTLSTHPGVPDAFDVKLDDGRTVLSMNEQRNIAEFYAGVLRRHPIDKED